MTIRRPRVAIIHPWFPQYRESFFSQLQSSCAEASIDLHVFHGDPPPEWNERGDSVTGELAVRLPTNFVSMGGRSLGLKSLATFHRNGPYDLVILEQAIRNLETYRILLNPRYRGKIAWWGHGKTYTESKHALEEHFKSLLTRLGCWFFAYTDGGVREVTARGFPSDRVTSVGNSVDSTKLRLDLASVTQDDVVDFRATHNLKGKTALFIGGLDDAKRLPFLLETVEAVHEQVPDFRLLIIGDGQQRTLVENFARSHPWCVYLGSLFGREKAIPMRASEVLVMPGRVGLAAVDSFVAGLPIVTTDWRYHAPEFDYLSSGLNAIVTDDSPVVYAGELADVLTSPTRLSDLKRSCLELADNYSIELMTARFLDGIHDALRCAGYRA